MANDEQIREEKKKQRRTLIRVGIGLALFGLGAYGLGKRVGRLETANEVKDQLLTAIVNNNAGSSEPAKPIES